MTMMKTMAGMVLAAGLILAPAAWAEAPSFNYVQLTGQHVNASAVDGWGWGAEASFNPAGGWFVSGNYRRVNHASASGANLKAWHTDAGYAVDLLDTLAVYGKLGWSRQTIEGYGQDSGMHYEAGLRLRLPIVQLEGGVGRYERNGGFNEYSATALFHVLPFTYVGVGYVADDYSRGSIDRWKAGVRLTF